MAINYYEVLGIDKTADPATIKKAYRTLAKKYHPDISKEPNAEQKFKEIAESYDILSNPEKRSMYDRNGFYSDGQFNDRYQRGNYYSGVNQADIKFTQFSNMSLISKVLLVIFFIIFGLIILAFFLISMIISAIKNLFSSSN